MFPNIRATSSFINFLRRPNFCVLTTEIILLKFIFYSINCQSCWLNSVKFISPRLLGILILKYCFKIHFLCSQLKLIAIINCIPTFGQPYLSACLIWFNNYSCNLTWKKYVLRRKTDIFVLDLVNKGRNTSYETFSSILSSILLNALNDF